MIPTTLTSNTPNTASGLNSSAIIASQQNIMGTSSKEMIIGIASLVIEGRAFAEDEFHTLSLRQGTPFPQRGPNNSNSNFELHETSYSSSSSKASTSLLLHGCDTGNVSGAATGFGGRQSPKPSTSKAATSVASNSNIPHLINITTNPHHAFGASTAPLFIETPNAYHSSSSAASSAESTHQRWTQKLCQLRQASGTANLTAPFEQKVAIETAQIASGEPELVSLAIHDPSMSAERGTSGGDYEIVRRVMLSHSSAATSNSVNATGSPSSSPNSGGSENFLHSLQSLATTCLRGSSPSLDSPSGIHYSSGCSSLNKYTAYRATANTTPRFHSPHTSLDLHSGSASSSGSGVQSPKLASISNYHKRNFKVTSTVTSNACSSTFGMPSALRSKPSPANSVYIPTTSTASETAQSSLSSSTKSSSPNSNSHPNQGPHCDQFLRKMGLAKGEAAEAEEHYCDMSYVNITCSRWRAYCLKIEGLIERGDPICIEVYLGPLSHRILVEQWIITYKEKVPPPTMTLSSLCSAIRSQLYFSQISAWCDLIRKLDKSIYDTGRIVYGGAAGMMGCAGDLATSTAAANLSCTPPNSSTSVASIASTSTGTASGLVTNSNIASSSSTTTLTNASLRPRLNVFYRIRPHNSTACFNSKPNIHNFPNVNISEYCSISICLKSLPRLNGGIPKLGAMMTAPNENLTTTNATAAAAKFSIDDTPRSSRQHLVKMMSPSISSAATATTSMSASTKASSACFSNCDNRKQQQQQIDLGNGSCSNGNSKSGDPKLANFNRYKTNETEQMMVVTSMAASCSKASKIKENFKKVNEAAAASTSNVFPPSLASSYSTNVNMQKCTFYIDESEQHFLNEHDDDDDIDTDEMNTPSCSNGSCGSLSHREKQLQKYRKRMLKRDKKHHNRKSFEDELNSDNTKQYHQQHQQYQPMDQGDDDDEESRSEQLSVRTDNLVTARQRVATIEMISTGTQTAVSGCCEQCGSEKSLVCLKCMPSVAAGFDEMDACSVNSLSSSEIISTPRSKGDLLLQAIQRTPKAAKHKKQTSRSTGLLNTTSSAPALNVRAGRTHSTQNSGTLLNNNHLANRSSSVACAPTIATINVVSPSSSTSSLASLGSGCQVCKRQKTQHNFAVFNTTERDIDHVYKEQSCESLHNHNENTVSSEVNTTEIDVRNGEKVFDKNIENYYENKKTLSSSSSVCNLNGQYIQEIKIETQLVQSSPSSSSLTMISGATTEVMDEECFSSSTKLTPHFDRCALSNALSSCSNVALIELHPPKKQPPPVPPKPMRRNQGQNNTAAVTTCQRSCTPSVPLSLNIDCEFKTPTPMVNCQTEHQQLYKEHEQPTPKVNLLQVASISDDMIAPCCDDDNCKNSPINGLIIQSSSSELNALHQRKALPKVNLTPLFCNSSTHCDGNAACCNMQHYSMPMSLSGSASGSSQLTDQSAFPFDIVTINRIKYERAAAAEATAAAAAQSYTANKSNINNNNNYNNNNNNNNNTATILNCTGATATTTTTAVPVQKSFSAPTLPNSPSLSPRFAKQAAIYKRRSRHLSDRSDRSSLGSDEQFSDEDADCVSNVNLINGIAISPMKQRARFATMFGRRPLLGNLEESLLQKRIIPKTEVLGFKVLLGASGGFCPTQLTIPASAYFYELHGETLSTPYLCEIRLPRKGYSVPRTGTVQATLLNPLGTVVRMFVIPYDMRDMPPLHQTFIRQRILADMSAVKIIGMDEGNAMQTGEINIQHNGQFENNMQNKNNQRNRANCGGDGCEEKKLGHFISSEHMKRLRYSIHLRFQTSRSGRLMLHTDIRLLISRRTDCDTAAAHAKGLPEAPNELITDTVMPSNPKYSVRHDVSSSSGVGNSRI